MANRFDADGGKLDPGVPPIPAPDGPVRGREPASPREEILCELFAQVLGVDRVGVEDSFFNLGGQSLRAIRLISRIRAVFGVEVPVRALFWNPTVAQLAKAMGEAGSSRPALVATSRPERLPLSFAQRRLWFLARLNGPSSVYNMPFAWRLQGRLDVDALRAALHDVVGRHESLRTVFPEVDGQPYQQILEAAEATPDVTVVEADPATLPRLLEQATRHVFDLATALPVRAWLFRLAPQEHVLLLMTHHIACDGWSMGILMRDLAEAYRARAEGQAPRWAELPAQYADYTMWERDLLGDGVQASNLLSDQVDYWTSALRGLPDELRLPYDRPRPIEPTDRGGAVGITLDAGLHRGLEALAAAHKTTLFMVLHAGLAALLSRCGAGTDIPIGTPVAGRSDEAVHDLVGFFVNTLVLRADLSGDPSFTELLARIRETDLAAYSNQDVPFERLVEILNPARSVSRHSLFQVMLISDNAVTRRWQLPGLRIEPEAVGHETTKFDLSLFVRPLHNADGSPAGIRATFEYATDLFDESTVEALAERLTRLLRQVADDPARPVSEHELLDDAERQRILHEWNDTCRSVPEHTLPRLFEQQAARTPDATAVLSGGSSLSYAALDHRANQLARHLAAGGVGPEQSVAVALPRGELLAVALLGVLKAGAAYLPVDLARPAGEVDLVLADARPAVLLADEATAAGVPMAGGPPVMILDDPATRAALASVPGSALADDERAAALRPDHPAYVVHPAGPTDALHGVTVTHRGVVNYCAWAADTYRVEAGGTAPVAAPVSSGPDISSILVPLLAGATVALLPQDGGPLTAVLNGAAGPVAPVRLEPSDLRAMAGQEDRAAERQTVLVVAGETLPSSLAHDWSRGGAEIHREYGPEECTVGCVAHRAGDDSGLVVPMGRPIWNTRVFVLDDRLRPVPPGVDGELYVAGAPLARGYLGRPGATAERFVACPFGVGERMFRTGDVVRWRPDGTLEFAAPIEEQTSPAAEADAGGGAPASPQEEILSELFAQVLGVDRVGVGDSFFDLGGHSLLAAVLVARITDRFGVELPLKTFFANPSVGAVSAHLGDVPSGARVGSSATGE
ncbi:condensation domain-containing protein [Micromonospora sp. NPDC000663]|uniref:condensation domain-containing protein n=1 Tax=Micromonospora sp. NPDC000663 TaxID=3364218 RepID=UPI00368F6BB8